MMLFERCYAFLLLILHLSTGLGRVKHRRYKRSATGNKGLKINLVKLFSESLKEIQVKVAIFVQSPILNVTYYKLLPIIF